MKKEERELLRWFRQLSSQQRSGLIEYAEYLARKAEPEPDNIAKIVPIARPVEESVVAAIKRLTATYPMLEPDLLLNETASLMLQHVTHGRAASEVIDDLEKVFFSAYEQLEKK